MPSWRNTMRFVSQFEFFLAGRFIRGHGRAVIFDQGTRLSTVFMALMVFVIVLVLSLFEGFQKEVRTSLFGSGRHLSVRSSTDGATLKDHAGLLKKITGIAQGRHVRAAYPTVSVTALLEAGGRFEGKLVRAVPVDSARAVTGKLRFAPRIVHFDRDIMAGFARSDVILVGRAAARHYGWRVGDRLKLFLPKGGQLKRGAGVVERYYTIGGFFRTGFYEFDMNLMVMALPSAQRVLGLGDRVTEIVMQMRDVDYLGRAVEQVKATLGTTDFSYSTIKDRRGDFLAALQLERMAMMIIMGLLVMAGSAGIWVTVRQMIRGKQTSIGMLRAMGMPLDATTVVFTITSMLVGFISVVIGASAGIFAAQRLESTIHLVEDAINATCKLLSSRCTNVELIPKHIYYFDHLPVSVNLEIIFGIALASLILSGFAGYLPARRAALADPVRVIRN